MRTYSEYILNLQMYNLFNTIDFIFCTGIYSINLYCISITIITHQQIGEFILAVVDYDEFSLMCDKRVRIVIIYTFQKKPRKQKLMSQSMTSSSVGRSCRHLYKIHSYLMQSLLVEWLLGK